MTRFVLALALLTAFVAPLIAQTATPVQPGTCPTERRVISGSFQPAAGPVKIAFFDADSTLRVAPSGSVSANGPTDVAILPLVAEQLVKLNKDGYLLAIVSNQNGISQGYVTFEAANAALLYTQSQLAKLGVSFHYYDFAERSDENRKPDIGMGKRLADTIKAKLGRDVDWAHTIMVGDSGWKKGKDVEPDGTPGEDFSNADRLFGENLAKRFGGVQFHHPRTFFRWLRHGVRNFPDYQSVRTFVTAHPELDPGVNPPVSK
ncbi:MAG: HAD-IIIA family hydrolase [Candidatus Riflebacteria bacterium]|nr:HAD-IIIA family hydrolase [Candidatus Riflebacteria bacterium]